VTTVGEVHPIRRQIELRLAVLAATLLALASALALGPLRDLPAFLPATEVPGWMFLPVLVAAELCVIRLRIRGRVTYFSLGLVPLVAGFFVVRPLWLATAFVGSLVIAAIWQRSRPAILVVNLGAYGLAAVAGIAVFRGLVGANTPFGLRAWLAAIAASIVVAAISLLIMMLVHRLRGEPALSGLAETGLMLMGAEVVNATIAFLGVLLVVEDPWMVVPILAVAVFLALAYRNYTNLLSGHESLERLYESTREIERPRGHRASIQALLDQTLELLGADTAELTFLPTDQHPAMVLVSGRDRLFSELPPDVAARMAAERAAELSGLGVEAPETDEEFAGFDEGAAAQLQRQILTAPLQGPSGIIGTIRVAMNYGYSFTDTDRRLLEMFANHASVALHNSRLIDELRAEVAEREHQALHDGLTALPNRVMFDLQTRQALDRREEGELVAVMLADLDRFKEVNDTLGHHHGDELLELLANRIGDLADGDALTVARLGGDEFAMLLRGARDLEQVREVAGRVREALQEPAEIAGVRVDVGASLGVAVAPRDGDDSALLLQRADVAMYVAKNEHRGVVFYEPEADPYSPQRLSLAADLRRAVERGEIEPHFQPVTSLVTGLPTSVEALARWTHPTFGVVPPDVFIPIAEQSGLIRELTYLILSRSLDQLRRWRSEGFDLCVGVNLSVRLLNDDDLVANIERHLERAGIEPAALTLEVTEGTIMSDPARAIAVLEDLHRLGVRLSIDDFGVGYSSLNQLKRLPVSQLKIDRSFVSALPTDHEDTVIVQSVINLGHSLGMQVVAEGVEDVAALDYLRSKDCDAVQGYYLSPPLPAAELLRWLRRRPSFTAALS
jgi:diguanylate cyclase (GGDEF)-like protein